MDDRGEAWRQEQAGAELRQPAAGSRPLPRTVEIVGREMAAILHRKTEAERLAIGWGLWRSARTMLTQLVRAEHPGWTEEQVNRAVVRRFAGGAP